MTTKKAPSWEALRGRSAKARAALDALCRDADALAEAVDVDAISAAAAVDSELDAWNNVVRQAAERLMSLRVGLENLRLEQTETFAQRLSRELTGRGLTVHGEGATLFVEGVVVLHSDVSGGHVTMNGATLRTLDVSRIAERAAEIAEGLSKQASDPRETLRLILDAYQEEVGLSSRPFGTQIETTALIYRMALLRQTDRFRNNPTSQLFQDYGQDQFRRDFYRLLLSQHQEVSGMWLRYTPGSSKRGAVFMLVPSLGRSAHVGRIWFDAARERNA